MQTNFSARDLARVALYAAFTAVLSQISIPLPFTPVPINLATLAVLLSGAVLGPYKGALSQLVFLALGAVGLPVFHGFSGGLGILLGPTGGYLIGYVAAAFAVGICRIKSKENVLATVIAMVVGIIVCYMLGTLWYCYTNKIDFITALTMCVLPFLLGDAIKISLAAYLAIKLDKLGIYV